MSLWLVGRLFLSAAAAAPTAEVQPRVILDARVDLVGLVERLSGDPESPHNAFTDAAAARFAAFSSHPAVTALAAARARGMARGVPAQYVLYLSSPPVLAEISPAPEFFAQSFGGAEAIDAWRRDLAAFARDSGFMRWEEETHARREAFAAAVRRARGRRDLGGPLARLLGARTWNDWTVIASLFFPAGGGDSWIFEERTGLPDVAVVFGPSGGKVPLATESPGEFAADVWPEAVFTMTYVLFEVCRPELVLSRDVCRGLPGLSNPEDCVQQLWVRELVSRLVAENFGARAERDYRQGWSPAPFDAAARRAVAAYAHAHAQRGDLIDAAGELSAPFQRGGAAPVCRVVDPARFGEEVYARRLAYYLRARLAVRPDPSAAAALAELNVLLSREDRR